MTETRTVTLDDGDYTVVLSDDTAALSAAHAAGGAIVGIMNSQIENQSLFPASYVLEQIEDADDAYLKRVVERHLGLPWTIAITRRLIIREFQLSDVLDARMESGGGDDYIFTSEDRLEAYIKNQYGFYEYGIWAVVEKESGKLVGKAGVTDLDTGELELGYHIFETYRKKGYAKEASKAILSYTEEYLERKVVIRIEAANEASAALARKLGFNMTEKRYNEQGKCICLYEQSC